MSGSKPVVKTGGGAQPIGDGDKLDPRYLPTFMFPNGEFEVEMGVDNCGQPQYLLKHPSAVAGNSSICGAACSSMISANVRVPVWVNGEEREKGSIVEHCGSYFVALKDEVKSDPSMAGTDWSKGYCDYALAVKHAISAVNTALITPHLNREQVTQMVMESFLDNTTFVTAMAKALRDSSATILVEDPFGEDQFHAFKVVA